VFLRLGILSPKLKKPLVSVTKLLKELGRLFASAF
jgi:hypothetical protein